MTLQIRSFTCLKENLMSDTNKDKYHAFAIAIMLTTDSDLRADFWSLSADQRTPDNLKTLIR